MPDPRHELGRRAESLVAGWLTRHGWSVVAHRARAPGGGEVDLVAVDPTGTLVAIEVRARRSSRAGAAAESVDAHRVRRLRRTLAAEARRVPHSGMRVDLVSVEPADADPATASDDGRWILRRIAGIDA